MSILVFAESLTGTIKKPALEAVTYAHKAGAALGHEVVALTIGEAADAGNLGVYGAAKVAQVNDIKSFDAQTYANIIAQAAKAYDAKLIVLAHSSSGKSLAGRLAMRLDGGSITGATSLPEQSGDAIHIKKNVFSGKGIATYALTGEVNVVTVQNNTFRPEEVGSAVTPENFDADIPESRITVKELQTVSGQTPLPEAEVVVSAGRGMKGPENWSIIEELAEVVGAATACSRPVADADWRPHHEHVGQTGVAIRPNLYFAIGISGAIQHLAGVNNSKVIVVINKDPEAPFFGAADYGVVGDLFDVVPRLIESFKKFRASQS